MYPRRRRDEEDDEYNPDNDGPEAKLSREAAEQQIADMKVIDRFLASLKPEDGFLDLFSWAEIDKWKLKRRRKR